MTDEYWYVQDFHSSGRAGPELRCADCSEAIARIRAFAVHNADPGLIIRVHVPAHATAEERHKIREIGAAVI